MAKKRGKKKSSKKIRKVKRKPVKKDEPRILAYASIVLGVIGSIVVVADLLALAMLRFINGPLVVFLYMAATVVFIICLLGVGLATADLMVFPESQLARKAMYFNLVVIAITFVLVLFGVF